MTAAAVVAVSSASARQPDLQPLAAELPALQLLQHVDQRGTPATRLAAFDRALTMLGQPTPFRGAVLCERATILQELERNEEALDGFEQCQQLRPDDPRVLLSLGFAEVVRQKPQLGTQHIIRAVELEPDIAHYIDAEALHNVQRLLSYSGSTQLSNRLADVLAKAGWGRENPAVFSSVVELAIRHALEAGNKAGALELLPSVVAHDPGVEMLIDRRFASIWPEIERWAGTDLSLQRRTLLEGASETYKIARTATSRLAYINALSSTGHTEDAIEALRGWLKQDAQDDDDSHFYYFQSVVILGRLLGEQGQRLEGIAQMQAALNSAGADSKTARNIVPNLVYHLLLTQDYQEALAILDRFTPKENEVEAPAALGYFVALRACALRGNGKSDAALEAYTRVRTVYASNQSAVEIATSCVGSANDQAALWIADVREESTRASTLVAMETARYGATRHIPVKSLSESAWRMIADRPDVKATFEKFGRPLADRYKPALVNFTGVPAAPVRNVVDGPVA